MGAGKSTVGRHGGGGDGPGAGRRRRRHHEPARARPSASSGRRAARRPTAASRASEVLTALRAIATSSSLRPAAWSWTRRCGPPWPTRSSPGCGPTDHPRVAGAAGRPPSAARRRTPRPASPAMAAERADLYAAVADVTIDADGNGPDALAAEPRSSGCPTPADPEGDRHAATTGQRAPARPSGSTACGTSSPIPTGSAATRGGGGARCTTLGPMPVPSATTTSLVEPPVHDHVGDVWYQRTVHVPAGVGRPAHRPALRRRHPSGRGVGRRPAGRRARGRLHALRGRPHRTGACPARHCAITVVVNNELTWDVDPARRHPRPARRRPQAVRTSRTSSTTPG